MADYLNLPTSENQKRIADALERLADGKPAITDYTNAPGAKSLVAGDRENGFYGFVSAQDMGRLIDNPEGKQELSSTNLALAVGLAQGTPINHDTPWMKFSRNGEILFVPVKPIRHTVSWNSIYKQGAVYGDGTTGVSPAVEEDGTETKVRQEKEVKIGNNKYRVQLLKGGGSDPLDSYSDSDRGLVGPESEWNNMVLPLHERAKLQKWKYKPYVGTTENWGIGLTDLDLVLDITFGTGSYSWCQETGDTEPTRRLMRGYYGVSYGAANNSWVADSNFGWRPVLRLIN